MLLVYFFRPPGTPFVYILAGIFFQTDLFFTCSVILMCDYISLLIPLKTRLVLIKPFLIIDLRIVSGNVSLCKIFRGLKMRILA